MEWLIVDGYNMIGAWPELAELKQVDLASARDRLIEWMAEYQAFTGIKVIVVFDAPHVQGMERKMKHFGIEILFTRENETADERIEKLASQLADGKEKVYVATSDFTEQWVIFGRGAYRKSARELYHELSVIQKKIAKKAKKIAESKPAASIPLADEVAEIFEKWRRGE
ncbi:MAG: NYN domain-containing protein [Caldibacillus debilis]|jgi:predicted RNA-binding protein with PIN domain|uniref:NYN domain-containing protein n=1 Tax=Caldibacillus debilis TaxID=301148 RepID=A0A150LNM1_9BACI|nr:NYN domain-containing protein [Caldibacillus debilis]MBO2482655.1 NYN domain-containing protein [Bacillaceae bacterium]KYD13649.1 hypothetical protein B4135_2888 [Caldibacillus debilis]MBY6270691.1 NYN domain-containing protein [Bacillaceae bacterium]OUM91206.1 MAG: hypothetical protein BAA03_02240 [Caldibacillus debilis]REJ19265.1 MAG: NYN domain-containing protein [Caldibacillus debilis]